MKRLLFSLSIFISFSVSAQFDQLNPDQNKEENKSKAPVCRDVRYRMVPDCEGHVYNETRNINGRDVDIIFHQKSGMPYTGECKVCHGNGNLWMYLKYKNGYSVGIDTVYYEDGKINLIRAHDEEGTGYEHGTWKFYREDGSLKWEKTYVYGAADGEQRYYFPDTTIQRIEVWKMNQLNGKKQEFYEGGQLKKEVDYKNGEWEGRYIVYFEDGKVNSEQIYVHGKKEGPSTYYHRNGNIFYTEMHSNGKREGEFKRFFENGRKWTVENYKNDLRHGHFEEYYDNEKNVLKYTAEYKKGIVGEEHFYDEFGDETGAPGTSAKDHQDKEADDAGEGGDDKKKKKKKKKDKE